MPINDNEFELRAEWLAERSLTESDVLVDEDGIEYVMLEPAIMDEGENEGSGASRRVDLPDFKGKA